MMTAVLIIVLLIALLALAVVVIVLRSFNSSSENVEIHILNDPGNLSGETEDDQSGPKTRRIPSMLHGKDLPTFTE